MMHRSAAALLAMKAPGALCREIGAFSAPCTTAKSETKKCLMIGENVYWLPSRFVWYTIPCLCGFLRSSIQENEDLQELCRDAPRNRSHPVPKLPCSCLSHLVDNNGLGSCCRVFDLFIENDSQAIAATLFLISKFLRIIEFERGRFTCEGCMSCVTTKPRRARGAQCRNVVWTYKDTFFQVPPSQHARR